MCAVHTILIYTYWERLKWLNTVLVTVQTIRSFKCKKAPHTLWDLTVTFSLFTQYSTTNHPPSFSIRNCSKLIFITLNQSSSLTNRVFVVQIQTVLYFCSKSLPERFTHTRSSDWHLISHLLLCFFAQLAWSLDLKKKREKIELYIYNLIYNFFI